jgi:hypothetical protein
MIFLDISLEICLTKYCYPMSGFKKCHRLPGEGKACRVLLFRLIFRSVADPGPAAFLTPASRMGKKSRSGSGMNIPYHISESLETIFFCLKYLNSLMRMRNPESF